MATASALSEPEAPGGREMYDGVITGPGTHACAKPEGACAETPLSSEPPLPDAEPLTSEPPLADAAPPTCETATWEMGMDTGMGRDTGTRMIVHTDMHTDMPSTRP